MFDITPVIQALFALMGVIITAVVIPLIRSKTTAAQRETIQGIINTAVFAAEQLYPARGTGAEKKNYVLAFLKKYNITYDADKLDAMIEAAVKQLNIEQGEN